MRHRRRANNISRDPAHRDAMVKNLVVSLFEHERIRTSPRKAKAARVLADKMITLGKKGTIHARRLAISRLGSKPAVRKLFTELGPRYQARHGGYTRILRLPQTIRLPEAEAAHTFKRGYGRKLGDGSELVYLELVEAEVTPRQHSTAERRASRKKRLKEFFETGAKREKAPAEAPDGAAEADAAEADAAKAKAKPEKKPKAEAAPKKKAKPKAKKKPAKGKKKDD